MIVLKRTFLMFSMNQYYFAEQDTSFMKKVTLDGYTHSLLPLKGLQEEETAHIDLLKEEHELWSRVAPSTRQKIKKATREDFQLTFDDNPSNSQLKMFRRHYNQFAKAKNIFKCNAFHYQTMISLRNQNSLTVATLKFQNEVMAIRIYITDNPKVMSLYSYSQLRLTESPEKRKQAGLANQLLLWKGILYFKERGFGVYDMGGLTGSESLRKYKLSFGGDVVRVYSGYVASTQVGNLIVKLRNMRRRPYNNEVTK